MKYIPLWKIVAYKWGETQILGRVGIRFKDVGNGKTNSFFLNTCATITKLQEDFGWFAPITTECLCVTFLNHPIFNHSDPCSTISGQ